MRSEPRSDRADAHRGRVRRARGGSLSSLWQAVRWAGRGLRRDPVYALSAGSILGVAVGAVAVVAAVSACVLLSPLPYPEAQRLVRVGQVFQALDGVATLSAVDALAIEEQQTSFESFGVVAGSTAALAGDGEPERIRVGRATAGFFATLRVPAEVGRLVGPEDEEAGAPPVVVLSHELAERRFGTAAAAVGRSVQIDGASHEVIGVLRSGRDELGPGVRAQAWPALRLGTPTRRGPFGLRGVGRLRRGVSVTEANRELATIGERIFPLWASSFRDRTARLTAVSLRESIVGDAARSLVLLGAAVLLVLLVAVVNVATLASVRFSVRRPEMAVRAALGAGRLPLLGLPLLEGLWLGAGSGLVGFAVAGIGLTGAGRLAPALPRIREVALDGRVAGVAALTALIAALLANLPAVVSASRASAALVGRGDRGRTGADRRATTLRGGLIAAQFALALPLLFGVGLLTRSFHRLHQVDPGFEPRGAVGLALTLPEIGYPGAPEVQRFWRRLEEAAGEVVGVSAAGVGTELPPSEAWNVNNFDLIDRPVPPGGAEHVAPWLYVTPGYLEVLGARLLDGRMFEEKDSAESPPVALVSRSWAERYYPGESALGREMIEGGCTSCPPTTVVGVVEDVKYLGLAGPSDAVYAPLTQSASRNGHLVVRTRAPAAITLAALRQVVAGLDPELPVVEESLAGRLRAELTEPRRAIALLGSFALAALLLAAFGLFGSMSYVVRQRRREIGLRIALGARRSEIEGMIVGRGLGWAGAGSALGLILALAEVHWLGALLFEVSASDPLTVVAATLLLLSVAAAASWLPGRRAARLDPMKTIAAD